MKFAKSALLCATLLLAVGVTAQEATIRKNLAERMHSGLFRQDLFFRISAFTIHLPALRDRTEDIAVLARHHYDNTHRENASLSPAALKRLTERNRPAASR